MNIDTVLAHKLGCAGEMAACKLLALEWCDNTFNRRGDGDAGGMEVRCTRGGRGHSLLLNQRDFNYGHGDRKFIYVESIGRQRFDVRGWAFGRDVMLPVNVFPRKQFVETIWKFPNDQLKPMHQLLQKDCSKF